MSVVIRIVQAPFVVRLRDWWSGLSSRERWLVGGLGVLLAALILVFGIIQPLQSARATALADIRTYETLNARIRAAGTLGPQATVQPRTGTPDQIVTQSAAGVGLALQVQPQPGGVRAIVAQGNYDAVMNWLADVARTSSLNATRVDIQKTATPGIVTATVDFTT